MQESNAVGPSTWVDPDDAPELTDEFFKDTEVFHGNTFVRRSRGRPKTATTKEQVTVRLDPDVLAKLREAGPGWQTRINGILRRAMLPASPEVKDELPVGGA